MANVLSVVWFVIGYAVTQTAVMVWVALMLPNPARRARLRIEAGPVKSFFIGAAFWAFTLLLITNMVKEGRPGPVQLIGWLLAGPMLASSVVGGAAFAGIVASRIQERAPSASPIAALVGGGLCTTLAGLLPIIGWVVFLPIISFIAIGSGAMALVSKKEVQRKTAEVPHPAEPLAEGFVFPAAEQA